MMRLKQTDAGALVPDPDHWTVEEAADFLVGLPAPLTRQQLGKLGKDCSMVCRIRQIGWTIRPTPNKPWPNERAYTQPVILEVFRANPDTRSYVPGIHTERVQ